ncbi:MAG: glycosyltransferase [Sarcina sp.]
MVSISLCMIVKNEEETLEKCLSSIKDIVNEIVIVDTGSTDKTKEIAKKFNAIIYDFKWINNFAAARNFAFSKATKEYILWLDGDDYLTEENINKFKILKNQITEVVDGVSMIYSLSRDENGKTVYSLKRNRLVKRNKNFKWIGRIHEYLEVGGNIIQSEIEVCHGKVKPHGTRNLDIFEKMIEENIDFTPRDIFYYANELYYNNKFEDAIKEYKRFIDSGQGWVEDVKTASMNMAESYLNLGDEEGRMNTILNSFKFDKPRADLCCKLAECFFNKNLFEQAIFWYKVALGCVPDKNNMGIKTDNYYTWIPAIQLCVCYSNIGDYDSAYYYNELTALYIPGSDKVEHNRKFLEQKFIELNKRLPELDRTLVERKLRYL